MVVLPHEADLEFYVLGSHKPIDEQVQVMAIESDAMLHMPDDDIDQEFGEGRESKEQPGLLQEASGAYQQDKQQC